MPYKAFDDRKQKIGTLSNINCTIYGAYVQCCTIDVSAL